MATMAGTQIDRLNAAADCLIESGEDEYDAYQQVARRMGLSFVRFRGGDPDRIGTDDGPQCEVYQDGNGHLVNLWIEGDFLGFDDQVD